MDEIFILLLVVSTTAMAYKASGRKGSAPLQPAIRAFIDYVGIFVLFLTFNVVVGAAVILLIRGLTPQFVALYQLQNLMLLFLSAAQAFVFQHWWRHD